MNNIKQHLTIERTVHIVMATFALASVSNVTAFFVTTDHHPIVALLMALALGTAVATTAIMLTMIDMVKQRTRYIAVGGMVLALVGVSGFVQTQNYLAHGLGLAVSATMGFGIVFSGEVLTAIALSLYQAAERRRKIDEADSGLELKLAETFADTLDSVDTANSAKYIQRHIDRIVRHKADELVSKYVPAEPAQTAQEPITAEIGTNTAKSAPTPLEDPTAAAEKSIEVRRSAKEKRHNDMTAWLVMNYAGKSIDDIPRTDIVDAFGMGRDTALKDLRAVWEKQNWNGEVPA